MGSRLLYWLILKPLSLLPYPVLYGISNVLFFFLYRVIGYRRKVVLDNLEKCFPEKSQEELERIMSAFYRHLCDLVVESVKNFSISLEQARSRMTSEGTEILEEMHRQGRSVILTGGHYNNWELWAVAAPPHVPHKVVAIYKKLSNTYFDRKMRESRGRYGLHMISTRETGNYMRIHADELDATVFAIDQSPSNPRKCLWINFLGRETGAHFGAEKYARTFDYPVIFCHLYKTGRGKYHAKYELLTDSPSDIPYGGIITGLHKLLEEDIRRAPEFWLWSHKRWKHKRPAEENFEPGEAFRQITS